MDRITVPYKVETQVATFQGDWTAEQIDNGEAGDPVIESHIAWFEQDEQGVPHEITDEGRIQELEQTLA